LTFRRRVELFENGFVRVGRLGATTTVFWSEVVACAREKKERFGRVHVMTFWLRSERTVEVTNDLREFKAFRTAAENGVAMAGGRVA
jgi:hypothetical protein